MKNIWITAIGLLLSINISLAQNARFITSGTIEYDKTANMFALIDRMFNSIDKDEQVYYKNTVDQYKKTQPQFKTLKATLNFDNNKTLFSPVAEPEVPPMGIYTPMADLNSITYSDLNSNIGISQKRAFEAVFLVKDTIRKIRWKITDETQEVAGFTCRRANALILDTVYVVAFYTDQIPVTGGPESFTGLPGMILKLALPHENVIWTATKVTDAAVPANVVVPPKKGKPVDNKELVKALESALKNAGPYKQPFYKALAL